MKTYKNPISTAMSEYREDNETADAILKAAGRRGVDSKQFATLNA